LVTTQWLRHASVIAARAAWLRDPSLLSLLVDTLTRPLHPSAVAARWAAAAGDGCLDPAPSPLGPRYTCAEPAVPPCWASTAWRSASAPWPWL